MTDKDMTRRKAIRIGRLRKGRNFRIAAVVCALLAVCVLSVGGTLAWLTAKTDPVTNTFSPSNISIDLWETRNPDNTVEDRVTDWSAKLVPGMTYPKNPVVKVLDDTDVDVYLFVELEEENNVIAGTNEKILLFDTSLALDSGWTRGEGEEEGKNGIPTDVWYREVKTTDDVKGWYLLVGDETYLEGKVKVNPALTMETMPAKENTPAIEFEAYAVQMLGMESAADAWAQVDS